MKAIIFPRKVVSVAVILFLTAVLFVGLISIQEAKSAPATIGLQSTAKVTKLIYPTFGNPAIRKKGTQFTIEFDPREVGASHWISIPVCSNFSVSVTSSNDPYPITRSLPVKSAGLGYSTQWPSSEYKQVTPPPDNRVYLVVVEIPKNIPADLYNLTVNCSMDGVPTSDTQINSFNPIDEFKEDFTFVQMSDIHVFGPECDYLSSNQKERHERHTNYVTTGHSGYGDGYGAEYLREAIVQLNKMKPDFIINTGDNMFGQKYFSQTDGQRGYGSWGEMTEYEFEQLWFYQEMSKLDIPVFMVLGNHDGYKESITSGARTDDDWQSYFKKLYGPLYRSFDYGNTHFSLVNSLDWAAEQRVLQNWLGIIMQPGKYKGQISTRGDNFLFGHSEARFAAENPDIYTGQLQWLKADLEAHQSSKLRVVAQHHDHMKNADPATSGGMWSSSESSGEGGTIDWIMNLVGQVTNMGNGTGRIACMRVMKDNRVGMLISGHDHSDFYSTYPWTDGTGHLQFINTTSTSFQGDGDKAVYPGYQKFNIDNGNGNFTFGYLNNLSYPFYQGTNVGGTTNLGNLQNPAIQHGWSYTPSQANATSATCNLTNTLTLKSMSGAYMEFPMQYLNDKHWYQVTNGTFGERYDNAGLDHRICQVYTDVGANSSKAVTVARSVDADNTDPAGTVKINDGAVATQTEAQTAPSCSGGTTGLLTAPTRLCSTQTRM